MSEIYGEERNHEICSVPKNLRGPPEILNVSHTIPLGRCIIVSDIQTVVTQNSRFNCIFISCHVKERLISRSYCTQCDPLLP